MMTMKMMMKRKEKRHQGENKQKEKGPRDKSNQQIIHRSCLFCLLSCLLSFVFCHFSFANLFVCLFVYLYFSLFGIYTKCIRCKASRWWSGKCNKSRCRQSGGDEMNRWNIDKRHYHVLYIHYHVHYIQYSIDWYDVKIRCQHYFPTSGSALTDINTVHYSLSFARFLMFLFFSFFFFCFSV